MDGWRVMEQASELARRGEAFALATVVWRQGPSSSQLGGRAIITASGELHGWIGGACAEPAVIREARQVITTGTPRLLSLGAPEQFGTVLARGDTASPVVPQGMTVVPIACQSEGALQVYIEPVLPVPHLVVVGRSPMAHALAELARVIGWRADLLDAGGFDGAGVGERSMVVVATQGHGDEDAIERAVAASPAYIGLVGSDRRGAAVLGYLADRGVDKTSLDRVRVPVGLDLGRTTHTEIAIAILAELVQFRASGALLAGGQAATATASQEAAQAADPVCGMTVTAGPASHPLTLDEVTYYFCCAGCRATFESSPASYPRRESRC
jgi:xanthine dehydrogenase accessory factor